MLTIAVVISMYAYDSNLCRTIGYHEDYVLFEKDMGSVSKWSEDWQLQLYLHKMKTITISIAYMEHNLEQSM